MTVFAARPNVAWGICQTPYDWKGCVTDVRIRIAT